jgi:hypothetical protein
VEEGEEGKQQQQNKKGSTQRKAKTIHSGGGRGHCAEAPGKYMCVVSHHVESLCGVTAEVRGAQSRILEQRKESG